MKRPVRRARIAPVFHDVPYRIHRCFWLAAAFGCTATRWPPPIGPSSVTWSVVRRTNRTPFRTTYLRHRPYQRRGGATARIHVERHCAIAIADCRCAHRAGATTLGRSSRPLMSRPLCRAGKSSSPGANHRHDAMPFEVPPAGGVRSRLTSRSDRAAPGRLRAATHYIAQAFMPRSISAEFRSRCTISISSAA